MKKEKNRILIVEDNDFMSKVLMELLLDFDDVEIIGVASDGKSAIEAIQTLNPDVVLLDIELPDMDGFELLSMIPNISFQIIFTTSHSHYAIKAFRINALDYLVKPVKKSELEEALNRVNLKQSDTLNNKLTKSKPFENKRISLSTQDGFYTFLLKNITYLKADRNYSVINLVNGKTYLSSKNLAHFENILSDYYFSRCHRSFIVNKLYIEKINGDRFILKDGVEINISRRKKTEVKDWFLEK